MITIPDFAFYKVILIAVDTFESIITDERHFSNAAAAESFAHDSISNNIISVIVKVK